MVRTRQGQAKHPHSCKLPPYQPGDSWAVPAPALNLFPHLLTPRSNISSVTASSASNCTEESAFTVTEPLLTAGKKALSRSLPQDIPSLCL